MFYFCKFVCYKCCVCVFVKVCVNGCIVGDCNYVFKCVVEFCVGDICGVIDL